MREKEEESRALTFFQVAASSFSFLFSFPFFAEVASN